MRCRTTTHALLDGEGVRGCPSSEAAVSILSDLRAGRQGDPWMMGTAAPETLGVTVASPPAAVWPWQKPPGGSVGEGKAGLSGGS